MRLMGGLRGWFCLPSTTTFFHLVSFLQLVAAIDSYRGPGDHRDARATTGTRCPERAGRFLARALLRSCVRGGDRSARSRVARRPLDGGPGGVRGPVRARVVGLVDRLPLGAGLAAYLAAVATIRFTTRRADIVVGMRLGASLVILSLAVGGGGLSPLGFAGMVGAVFVAEAAVEMWRWPAVEVAS